MTTTTTKNFPADKLLTCAKCGSQFSLTADPEPRYNCPNSCGPSFRARKLNRLLIPQITAVVITDATFPKLRERFMRLLKDTTGEDTGHMPSDDEIRQLATDPDSFLKEDAVTAAAELLASFIDRIELEPGQATIQYALALPPGSDLAGSQTQEVRLPESVTS